jgi:PRC-barrel domain protein
MDHPRPSLRYVDAKDLEDKAIKLRGLEVEGARNEKLGKLEGFIIDVTTGRPYHVVVGSGGWFKHKHFLLPIGHVALSPGKDKLIADITKDRVERFPGFDKDEFKKLSEEDLKKLDAAMSEACCPTAVVAVEVVEWETAHHAYPSWWNADFYRRDPAELAGMNVAGAAHLSGGSTSSGATSGGARGESRERERMVASGGAGDVTDNAVRAQPGDVLGLDTDGERTYIGDTSEDEDRRRVEAEKKAAKP